MRLLGEMHRGGLTVVLVTHNPGVARNAARVLHMQDGLFLDGGGP